MRLLIFLFIARCWLGFVYRLAILRCILLITLNKLRFFFILRYRIALGCIRILLVILHGNLSITVYKLRFKLRCTLHRLKRAVL